MNKIYCISFSDGKKYIGVTKNNLEQRIKQHAHPFRFSSWDLFEKMQREKDYTVHVLEEHESREDAEHRERELIQTTPNLINRLGLQADKSDKPQLPHSTGKTNRKYRKRHYERDDRRNQRCRHCRIMKPAADYYTDHSRSSGLASQCRECRLLYERIKYHTVKAGGTASEGYAKYRALIKSK